MKLYLVLILCCAVTVFAAPAKEKEKEEAKADDLKAKGKISVEVKPTDLQVKLSPVKFQAKFGEKKSIVTTSTTTTTTTTEPTTIEPTEADETNNTPQQTEEAVKPTKTVKQTAAPKKVKTEKGCALEFKSKTFQ